MSSFRKLLTAAAVAVAALTTAGLALAHGNHGPRHGGIVDADRMTSLEFVVRPDKVEVYMLYDEEPVSSKGLKGTVKITPPAGPAKTFALTPDGPTRLAAKGAKAPEGSTAEVTVTGGYESPSIGFFRIK